MSGEGILPNDPNPRVMGWDLGHTVAVHPIFSLDRMMELAGGPMSLPTPQDMREWLDEFNTREWRDEQPFNRRCPHGEFIEITGCWQCIEEGKR